MIRVGDFLGRMMDNYLDWFDGYHKGLGRVQFALRYFICCSLWFIWLVILNKNKLYFPKIVSLCLFLAVIIILAPAIFLSYRARIYDIIGRNVLIDLMAYFLCLLSPVANASRITALFYFIIVLYLLLKKGRDKKDF